MSLPQEHEMGVSWFRVILLSATLTTSCCKAERGRWATPGRGAPWTCSSGWISAERGKAPSPWPAWTSPCRALPRAQPRRSETRECPSWVCLGSHLRRYLENIATTSSRLWELTVVKDMVRKVYGCTGWLILWDLRKKRTVKSERVNNEVIKSANDRNEGTK